MRKRIEVDLANLEAGDQVELHTYGTKSDKMAIFTIHALHVEKDRTLALGWGNEHNYVIVLTDELGPLTVWRPTEDEELAEAIGFLSTHPELEHCHPDALLQAVLAVAQEANDAAPDDLPQG